MKKIKSNPEPIYNFEAGYPYSYEEDLINHKILFEGDVLVTWEKLTINRTDIETLIKMLNGAYNFGRMKQLYASREEMKN